VTTNPYLQVTCEILGALDQVTRAGQSPLMRKVLDILRREALRPDLRLAQPEVAALMGAIEDLEHEAARRAPDPAAFNRRAQVVVAALSAS
jgi:hypothetical protein